MLFNSLTFGLLLVVGLAVRHFPLNWTFRKSVLLLLSYIFYGAWNPIHLLILWSLTLIVWWLGGELEAAASVRTRRAILAVSIIVTLLPLVFFKYFDFALQTLNSGLGLFRWASVPTAPRLLLPIGISFYTFEAIAYSVDLYKRRIERRGTLLDFGLFLAFFPRMVSGPIMRAGTFLPQCEAPNKISGEQMAEGITMLILGLFEKVVLADAIFAPVADQVYTVASANNMWCAWIGTAAFAFQIYFDFAGYSTSAIGIAKLLGFELPANFNSPYSATNLSDFWRRWHISLSTWLRDYLYIPLGGNRLGAARTKANLMLTMALGGLWHGAGLRFIAWGVLHGAYLAGQRSLSNLPRPFPSLTFRIFPLVSAIWTFVLVSFGWVFFRATSLMHGVRICRQMIGLDRGGSFTLSVSLCAVTMGAAIAAFAFQWKCRQSTLEATFDGLAPAMRVLTLTAMIVGLLFAPGDNRAFIYFQF